MHGSLNVKIDFELLKMKWEEQILDAHDLPFAPLFYLKISS
jgi:hypothetical protein